MTVPASAIPGAASQSGTSRPDTVPEQWAEPVAYYVERLVALCGSRLLAVTFYGPWPLAASQGQTAAKRGRF